MLAAALQQNKSLTRLSLESNVIGDAGANAILVAALLHERLASLNLGKNRLTDASVVNLPPIVRLQDLYLNDNDLSDMGALDLAKAVMHSESLRWLELRSNRLTTRGIAALNLFLKNGLYCKVKSNEMLLRS